MEDNLVLKGRSFNVALFRLENLEALKLPRQVCSSCKIIQNIAQVF